MRLGDRDREELLALLAGHAAAGRLDVPELERRVEVVITAETREEAVAVLNDLPAPEPELPSTSSRPRRGRGHGDADQPAVDWRPTSERFRDPRTNRVMRVWEDARGARHYVPDDRV